jgi:hypothetical protein
MFTKISDIAHIVEGNVNVVRHFLGVENGDVEAKATKRLEVCNPCDNNRPNEVGINRCILCGCPIESLVRSNKGCKANKWTI